MNEITVTPAVVDILKQKQLADKTLLLITDDAGGKYSLQGGACSIGTKFTIVVLDQPDDEYNVALKNNADLSLYTSDYDVYFLGQGLKLDVQKSMIKLTNNGQLLDNNVQIADGKAILAAFQQGVFANSGNC
ncbi:iron-sulfur cluster biosynthesis family protein [Lactobacillus sp. LC28-10]|uniref:Iron-sulfur cluster biosynthesis family protein n=1 Tax=Secundilactobacillus angelensis TaxID=2722706 RepID=A0ABX1L0S7_9LACO|nr:iron-sulfur cluster biosynthesis family protein [Secundilactobacillus angelensis]MCH5461606.1 iron-sulfur cluster biosynthesis family protein [Secundilactobacillus angelensis]NLR17901.1 iron-sulfur cluster biosynthesis family protein [Secundilactobacillus angelensis]